MARGSHQAPQAQVPPPPPPLLSSPLLSPRAGNQVCGRTRAHVCREVGGIRVGYRQVNTTPLSGRWGGKSGMA